MEGVEPHSPPRSRTRGWKSRGRGAATRITTTVSDITRNAVGGRLIRNVRGTIVTTAAIGFFAAATDGRALDLTWESVGVRSGFSSTDIQHPFTQTELFADWNLPWDWQFGNYWSLRTRLELTLGGLTGQGEIGFIGSAGMNLILSREGCPFSMDGGVNPTLLSQDTFGNRQFGIVFQFTNYAGLNWEINPHWRLGYQFQHMSNAGLGSHNAGLNMQLFGLSYKF